VLLWPSKDVLRKRTDGRGPAGKVVKKTKRKRWSTVGHKGQGDFSRERGKNSLEKKTESQANELRKINKYAN